MSLKISLRASILLYSIVIFLSCVFIAEGANYKKNVNSNKISQQLDDLKLNTTRKVEGQRQSCKCGLSNPVRIIGGEEIDLPRKYPWMVYVRSLLTGACTGTLISSGHVLTAAHCVHTGKEWIPNSGITVYIGDHNINEIDDNLSGENSGETRIMKAKFVKQPKFNSETLDYDIVLLKLEEQLDLNEFEFVRPICLTKNAKAKYFRKIAISAGWGVINPTTMETPDTPYELTLKTTKKNCRGHSPTKNQICADILWEKETPYFGDSGGPLMVEENGRYIQIGVLSGAVNKNDKGKKAVGVWASVAKRLKWITKKIKKDNRCV